MLELLPELVRAALGVGDGPVVSLELLGGLADLRIMLREDRV